jgi:hypothetical protein
LAENPDLEGEEIYDFLGRYVRRVHSDDFIRRALKYYPQSSFVDVMTPSDIAYVIAIVKNSGEMWDQNVRMKEMGQGAMASQEKKLRPLFTQGEGMKRDKGETLWNREGRQFFASALKTWKEIYNSKDSMKIVYNKWERWITTKGKEIKIGEGKKTFHSVMGTWNNKRVASLKKANDTDDGEGEEVEGGYNSDTGRSRESLGWRMGLLREEKDADDEESVNDNEGDEEEDEDRDGDGDGDGYGDKKEEAVKVYDSPAFSTRRKRKAVTEMSPVLFDIGGEKKKRKGGAKKK